MSARIPDDTALDDADAELRERANRLPPEARRAFHDHVARTNRDPDTYSALNWSLPVGLHHIYMGDWAHLLGTWAAMALGLAALAGGRPGLGALIVALVVAAELREVFFAKRICRARNLARARAKLTELAG